MRTGAESTRLIVLRGNSGSGKSSIAAEIRARHGRGIALVSQDNLRRVVLRERDTADGANIGLIDMVARYALDRGLHVIIDGILYEAHYGAMLRALRADHRGLSRFYYLDVPFEETMRRHATRPQAGIRPGRDDGLVPGTRSAARRNRAGHPRRNDPGGRRRVGDAGRRP